MPNIEYVFVESGKESVKGAFREIGGEARSAKRDVDAALRSFEQLGRVQARRGGARAGRPGGAGANAAEREAAADETRRQRQALRDRQAYQERLAKDVAASQQRRERETQHEQSKTTKQQEQARSYQERLAKEVAAGQQRRDRDAQRFRARAAKDQERDLGRHSAALKGAADERARDREKEHRRSLAFDKIEEHTKRKAHADATQRGKAQATRDIELDRERKRIQKKNQLFSGVGGELKGLALGAGLAVGAVGIGVTGAAARDALRVRELANRISINSRLPGQAAIDPAVLQKEFEQTAIRTPGQTAAGVGEALQGFVTKTGRADVGRQSLGTFATVASASGADIRDVSNAAADLFQKFDITSIEDMSEALAALTVQGKRGAFELKDAAANFSRMSAAASRFGIGTGIKGAKTLGGLSQIAQESTGNAERTATAVEATLRQFIVQAGTIKTKFGVDVFKDKGKTQTNDIQDVIVKTIAGAKGNQVALTKVFGGEGMPAISPLISLFNKTTAGTVGTEAQKTAAGIAAMRARLADAIEVTNARSEIERDAAQAQQDASAKLTASWERLQSKVGDAVIPMLADLADKFASSPEVVDAFIGTIEVMIDAMKGFVLVLEDLGIVKKKAKAPEQVEKEQREKVASLDKQIAEKEKAAGGTVADVFRLQKEGKGAEAEALQKRLSSPELLELRGQRMVAANDVGKAQAETARVVDIQQNIRTKDQFMQEYAALADPNAPKRMLGGGKAGGLSQATAVEESAAQKEFRLAQDQAKTEERTRLGVGEGQQGVDLAGKGMAGFIALNAAALKAAAGLERIAQQGQPSPVGS